VNEEAPDLGAEVIWTIEVENKGPDTAVNVNVASVASDTFDADMSNNSDDATVDAIAADLELTKSVMPEAVTLGELIEWQIAVSNKGPDAATGVVVQDVMPAGVTYQADTSGGAFDAASGLWTVGDLAVGETVTLNILAEVVETGELINLAQISASDQVDTDSEVNNYADETRGQSG